MGIMEAPEQPQSAPFVSFDALQDILGQEDDSPTITPEEAAELPDDAVVCWCNNVTAGEIRAVLADGTAADLEGVQRCTRASGGCGKCLGMVTAVVDCALHGAR